MTFQIFKDENSTEATLEVQANGLSCWIGNYIKSN